MLSRFTLKTIDHQSARASIEALESRMLMSTSLISVNTSGTAAVGGSGILLNGDGSKNFSPDGRFVLFTSTATNLVNGVTDTNSAADVFLRDRVSGTTTILSVDAAGNALGASEFASFVFSPDSQRLLFRSGKTGIVAGLTDTNNSDDWFVRNLLTGVTSCINVNAAGTSTGNSNSFSTEPPVFSPDGKSVAFLSISSDLVTGITDSGGEDLFLRNLDTNTTSLISVNADGVTASGQSPTNTPPTFSPDGRFLAFIADSAHLVSGITDADTSNQLYVRDLQTNTTLLVTRTLDNKTAGMTPFYQFSPDGKFIAFGSQAANLVAGVTDVNPQVNQYTWDVTTHQIALVDATPNGLSTSDKQTILVGVSPDSRFIAFTSAATNLTPQSAVNPDALQDLYVRDLQTGTTAFVARNASASVTFNLVKFSPDGVHLLFGSDATDVVPGITDTNGFTDLFLYNLQTGAMSCVTINHAGTATDDADSFNIDDPVFSPNGRYLTFVSDAKNLVSGVTFSVNNNRNLFVRDTQAGTTTLVTEGPNNTDAGFDQGANQVPEFDPGNQFLVYTDNAFMADGVTTPFNSNFSYNLYAFDVVSHTQHLLTVNAAGTAPANSGGGTGGGQFNFVMNPAGGSVLFDNTASDMVAGVTDTVSGSPSQTDIFLATLSDSGNPGGGAALVSLSGDGVGIASGDASPSAGDGTDFDSTAVGTPVAHVFTVTNNGTATLTTSGLILPAGFTLTDPLNASIAAGTSDAFTVQFDAAAAGTSSGNVSFTTNDSGDPTVTFAITATATPGNPAPGPVDGPDLVIEGGVTGVKAGNFVGGTKGGKAAVKVFNRGTEKASGSVQVEFFASLDGTLDGSDVAITTVTKSVNLKVGKNKTIKAKFNYPAGAPDGNYFILAKVDANNAFAETDENNNVASSPAAIGIAVPFVDLTGTSLVTTGTFKAGKKGKATLSLFNGGNVSASGANTMQLFLSADDIFGNGDDILVATLSKGLSLKAGKTKKFKFKPDLANVIAGSYHAFAVIDTGNTIAESNDGNNTASDASIVTVV